MSLAKIIEAFGSGLRARAAISTTSARTVLLAVVSSFAWLGCASPPEPAREQRRWSVTGEMLEARAELVAALLPSGQVLVAGGIGYPSPADGGAGTTDWTCLSS